MSQANFYNQFDSSQEFDQIKINIASSRQIRSWSYGEVKKPETINYRTFKPEKDGLFCAKIFGPVKDYECLCGKYKRMKYKGLTCEKCGVEITTARVRRERMGHIELAAPVAHIWFLKSLPSRISTLLDMTMKDVEKILYFEKHVVTNPGVSPLRKYELLDDDEYVHNQNEYGFDSFTAMIGAEAIQSLLKEIDLDALRTELRMNIEETSSEMKKKKILKRLKLVEDFIGSGNKPEWMVMNVLPILPPEIRPLVMLDGGRFAASDLNELYRRVINRNNRLRRLIDLMAPDIIIRNEKRMLQESVDALLDNGRRGKVVKNAGKRPFKSLSDMLKGKQGRFRQNLLGKRVDYSGRSVIVVGPELRLYQCGLPKQMALELFKPFIYSKLELYGIATTIKSAKKMVEADKQEVWDVLEEVVREHPVLLNRAPTLHRLGIQAFEPVLIEGKAIRLHPLVCTAFNADFDGDTMSVHVMLSIEAQMEARVLMMSTNNILSPANGKPIISADKDIVLGLYSLTLAKDGQIGEGSIFEDVNEVELALLNKSINIHAKIKYRVAVIGADDEPVKTVLDTTVGRVLFGRYLPKSPNFDFRLINKEMTKKDIADLINTVHRYCNQKETVVFVDRLMNLGFKYSSEAGISFGMDDMIIPASKTNLVREAERTVNDFEQQYLEGLITRREKSNKALDAWSICSDKIAKDAMNELASKESDINSIYMMFASGARGSATQIKQLSGMRGLMTKPSGEIIEMPIKSNFKEGLTVREYFDSTHGARKGLADTALKTANSGYLTRRLVDVAQDLVIREYDCKTKKGLEVRAVIDGGEVIVSLSEQVLGRTVLADTYDLVNNDLLFKADELIDEDKIEEIELSGIDLLTVRSPITCEVKSGVCARCYGRDLGTGRIVGLGEAVGVIAAQSIGEPGTQLTMRTFHIGGAATKGADASGVDAFCDARVKLVNCKTVLNSQKENIVMSRACEFLLIDKNGLESARYKIPQGSHLLANDGDNVKQGQRVAEWDPYNMPIITEKSGKVVFADMIEGMSIQTVINDMTGIGSSIIMDSKRYSKGNELRPRIQLLDKNGDLLMISENVDFKHYLPVGAILSVKDGDHVVSGDVLARIPRESGKTKDITGGLPRVEELFEARRPKDTRIVASANGKIEFGKSYQSKRKIFLHPEDSKKPIEYLIPKGRHLLVNDSDAVNAGDIIVDGNPVPEDILKIMGVEAFAKYMISEIQAVYRLQGVKIDDKHVEVIIRQMLQKVEIKDSGDSSLLQGNVVDVSAVIEINNDLSSKGRNPAKYEIVLQGITKASLQTESFISAASFQETTKVLTAAAVAGKTDYLKGLKESVIVGQLIRTVGTGLYLEESKKQAMKLKNGEVNPNLEM